MSKLCLFCGKPVPSTRKRSSQYCSNEHYYEAKKLRSNVRYDKIKSLSDKVARNEKILESLYPLTKLKKVITYDGLNTLGFDWGISCEHLSAKDGTIWTVVGQYAYYIDPETKNVSIWKKP